MNKQNDNEDQNSQDKSINQNLDTEVLNDLNNIHLTNSQMMAYQKLIIDENYGQDISIQSLRINSLKDFPFKVDTLKETEELLASGVLRNHENKQFNQYFHRLLISSEIQQLNHLLFFIILFKKYPEIIASTTLMNQLHHQFNERQLKILLKLPKPSEEMLTYLIFAMTYIIHKMIFFFFPKNQSQFNLRFILDCYHLAIFEFNQLLVTDYYLQINIDKIFSYQFLEYERDKSRRFYAFNGNNNNKKQGKKANLNQDRLFLGQKLEVAVPSNQDSMIFFKSLKDTMIGKYSRSLSPKKQKQQQQLPGAQNSQLQSQQHLGSANNLTVTQSSQLGEIKMPKVAVINAAPLLQKSGSNENMKQIGDITDRKTSLFQQSLKSPVAIKFTNLNKGNLSSLHKYSNSPPPIQTKDLENSEKRDSEVNASPSNESNSKRNLKPLVTGNNSLANGISQFNQTKITDRLQQNRDRRYNKVDLEVAMEREDGLYENICPSLLRMKSSGRNIAFKRLQYKTTQVSKYVAQELNLKDNSLPDIQKKVIFHPIDRVLQRRNLIQELEDMKNDKEDKDNSQKLERKASQDQYKVRVENVKQSGKEEFRKTKPLLQQYEMNFKVEDQKNADKAYFKYNDVLELKMVLDNFQQKVSDLAMVKKWQKKKNKVTKIDIMREEYLFKQKLKMLRRKKKRALLRQKQEERQKANFYAQINNEQSTNIQNTQLNNNDSDNAEENQIDSFSQQMGELAKKTKKMGDASFSKYEDNDKSFGEVESKNNPVKREYNSRTISLNSLSQDNSQGVLSQSCGEEDYDEDNDDDDSYYHYKKRKSTLVAHNFSTLLQQLIKGESFVIHRNKIKLPFQSPIEEKEQIIQRKFKFQNNINLIKFNIDERVLMEQQKDELEVQTDAVFQQKVEFQEDKDYSHYQSMNRAYAKKYHKLAQQIQNQSSSPVSDSSLKFIKGRFVYQ